jgi:hypothetical protein
MVPGTTGFGMTGGASTRLLCCGMHGEDARESGRLVGPHVHPACPTKHARKSHNGINARQIRRIHRMIETVTKVVNADSQLATVDAAICALPFCNREGRVCENEHPLQTYESDNPTRVNHLEIIVNLCTDINCPIAVARFGIAITADANVTYHARAPRAESSRSVMLDPACSTSALVSSAEHLVL